MKPRPRRVENQIAAHLSEQFLSLGYSPVERIPVLGRTGPDITVNESKLAMDVKSRLEVPKLLWETRALNGIVRRSPGLLCLRVSRFAGLFAPDVQISEYVLPPSKLVTAYLEHMKQWADEMNSIPAVILHRPRMNTANAVFVMYESDLSRLKATFRVTQTLEVVNGS